MSPDSSIEKSLETSATTELSGLVIPEFEMLKTELSNLDVRLTRIGSHNGNEINSLRRDADLLRARIASFGVEQSPVHTSPQGVNPQIHLSDIVVIPKHSKLEWDMKHFNLSEAEMMQKYKTEGANYETILASHHQQLESLTDLKSKLGAEKFSTREALEAAGKLDSKVVIALGGDNHFIFVSHFVTDGLILGINSDPIRSEGALTSVSADKFERVLEALERGDYRIEEWPRLEVYINGKLLGLATSEIFIGEEKRQFMSRYVIKHAEVEESQKSSGLIISTGAGSTGWYDSACRYLFPYGDKFPRTDAEGRFLATEPYQGKLNRSSLLNGKIKPGEELIIKSLNDDNGKASIDSLVDAPFGRGTVIQVRLASKPLRVITFD